MIRYDLVCADGHEFDGWFRDSDAYDAQAFKGLVACAVCGTIKVEKQMMAPGIPAKSNRKTESTQPVFSAPADPRPAMLMKMMREMRQHVEANAENVGQSFAEEARKIHYNEAEKRSIFGESTADEAMALLDEGIEVHPLPRLPEDGN